MHIGADVWQWTFRLLEGRGLAVGDLSIGFLFSLVFLPGLIQEAFRDGYRAWRTDAINHSRATKLLLPVEFILGMAAGRVCQVRLVRQTFARFWAMGAFFRRKFAIVFRRASEQAATEASEIGRRRKRNGRIFSRQVLRRRDLRRGGDARRSPRINANYGRLGGDLGAQHQNGFMRARKEHRSRQRQNGARDQCGLHQKRQQDAAYPGLPGGTGLQARSRAR